MKTRFIPSAATPFDRMVMDFLNDGRTESHRDSRFVPSANIAESNDFWQIELMVPGMSKEQFSLKVENNQLVISADVKSEVKEADLKYNFVEFEARSFVRSFNLPKGKVREEGISASYDNGILVVNVPKLEEAKPKGPRVIEIQ